MCTRCTRTRRVHATLCPYQRLADARALVAPVAQTCHADVLRQYEEEEAAAKEHAAQQAAEAAAAEPPVAAATIGTSVEEMESQGGYPPEQLARLSSIARMVGVDDPNAEEEEPEIMDVGGVSAAYVEDLDD